VGTPAPARVLAPADNRTRTVSPVANGCAGLNTNVSPSALNRSRPGCAPERLPVTSTSAADTLAASSGVPGLSAMLFSVDTNREPGTGER
jgi:hypothetical protein